MPSNVILDLFYNELVPEASKGRVDAFFILNLVFNLNIENKQITSTTDIGHEHVIIPTLKITNKELFDSLLVEYVNKVIEVYDDKEFSFLNDIEYLNLGDNIEELKQKYLIKYIIATLIANASYIDFDDPVTFLQNRISMLEHNILPLNETINLGYFERIGATLYAKEEISPTKSETPYRIKAHLEYDDGYKLLLPEIYMGETEDKYIIYGIQKTTPKSDIDESKYIKQVRKCLNSRLYGIPEHYFLTYILSLVLANDKPIDIVPFLIERWNAKAIAISHKKEYPQELKEQYLKSTQENITNAFLRAYFKIQEVTPEIITLAYPFTIDDHLHLSMLEEPHSKASVMNDLYHNYQSFKKDNITYTKK